MATRTDASAEKAFDIAWALFWQLHDAPSRDHADQLVQWLAEDPKHVKAFDEALTVWALAGGAMVAPMLRDARRGGSDFH
jgi:ferric-dicitrate binding protein FerR (iron transport regulator)